MADHKATAAKVASEHEESAHLAINNTLFKRLLTGLAIKTTGRVFKSDGICKTLSRHVIVKAGRRVHLTEAATLKFIAENTSIPVPKIKGDEFPTVWRELSEPALERVLARLRSLLQEMRSLQPPANCGVQSCTGGRLLDYRICHSKGRFGPFKTIQDFHLWLRERVQPNEPTDWKCENDDLRDLVRMAEMQDGPWPAPIFTHADLNPFNILVQAEDIVGIIDWEFSDWYPSYWEHTSAWCGNVIRTGWQDLLPKILDRWWGEI